MNRIRVLWLWCRSHPRIFGPAVSLLSILVGLGFLELGVRIWEFVDPSVTHHYLQEEGHEVTGHRYVYDSMLGWRNIPNWKSTTYGKPLTINSHGLRDREYSWKKPPGTRRILVLGDSCAWGYCVADNEVFSEVLEKDISSSPDSWEVINSSVSGWGTDQEYLYFTQEGYRYEPDIVVLMFSLVTDPPNNRASMQYGLQKPLYRNTDLELTNVPVPFPITSNVMEKVVRPSFLFESSALVRLCVLRSLSNSSLLTTMQTLGVVDLEEEPTRGLGGNPLLVTSSILQSLEEDCSNIGAELVLMKFGSFLYPNDPQIPQIESDFAFRVLRRLKRTHYIDVDARFAKDGISKEALLKGSHDDHWNAMGHVLTARYLRELLEAEPLLKFRK